MTMDVSYIARNLRLPESFLDHVVERTERLQPLAEGADTLEVRVTKSSHHKHSDETVRVELTVRGPRDVVRAEADADDKLVAFDQAATRLAERLRRMRTGVPTSGASCSAASSAASAAPDGGSGGTNPTSPAPREAPSLP